MSLKNVLDLIFAAVITGAPLLFGTVGETLSEKSGNLNLGVEGMMYMGGAFGLGAVYYYEQAAGVANGPLAVAIALLAAFAAGAFGALLFSFLTITLRVNQNVTGLALAIFDTGVGQFTGELMRVKAGGFVSVSNSLKAVFSDSPFPKVLQDLPVVGQLVQRLCLPGHRDGGDHRLLPQPHPEGALPQGCGREPRHRRRGGHQRHPV